MRSTTLGIAVGAVLGLLDGLSAWFTPEARPMLMAIVLGSTLKGVLTGLAAGLIARVWRSLALAILGGIVVGFALSTIAARGEPGHYWEIVLPGMLLGAIVGFVTQRYGAGSSGHAQRALALVLAASAGWGTPAAAQPVIPDAFQPIAGLIGRWSGTTEGQPGTGTVERDYELALGGRFIRVRNRSTYPPQEKNPKGEIHQDEGFFSFDRARKRLVLRQFHLEGFVNQYVQDEAPADATIAFTSEAIENIPSGYRARERYILRGDELEEIFELAEPGKPFTVYSRNTLKRVK
jgi:hypothetical protein